MHLIGFVEVLLNKHDWLVRVLQFECVHILVMLLSFLQGFVKVKVGLSGLKRE